MSIGLRMKFLGKENWGLKKFPLKHTLLLEHSQIMKDDMNHQVLAPPLEFIPV